MNAFSTGEFNGKRVLVTGGTKGAGKAIADRFLQGGATVMITARSAPEEKSKSHFIQADVSTSDGTAKVIREILESFNPDFHFGHDGTNLLMFSDAFIHEGLDARNPPRRQTPSG